MEQTTSDLTVQIVDGLLYLLAIGGMIYAILWVKRREEAGLLFPPLNYRVVKWGIPLQGPQDGPPCNRCNTPTIASYGPCYALYWCVKCKRNATPK